MVSGGVIEVEEVLDKDRKRPRLCTGELMYVVGQARMGTTVGVDQKTA